MPIRTNRGRAAVYRRLWGWPMRSPRHLIITVTVIAVAVTAIGLIVPRLTGDDTPRSAAATLGGASTSTPAAQPAQPGGAGGGTPGGANPTTPPSGSTLPTRLSGPTQSPTPAPPSPKALEVATAWAKAWVNHPPGTTVEQWLNGLRSYTTEEQLAVMGSVDLERIPATEVTGPAVATNSYTSSVEVTVPTNGGTLSITVINTSLGWRVAHYEQAA
ncbi:MAG TPA: hypothetical protein VGX25_09310 [Actinophytocola sp.]|uniref:hypothetical protein n=1 Tax=Actinophytocola sp. TaxID=1872138 RepID=UPI002DDD6DD2|nr:hypothetical protein [Actinophytocola sp.]HEV2779585.1 hypothetical protein [Actinophytocola sp.]